MSQCARVLAVLQEGGWKSIDEIHNRAGTMRLNSRISDLRDQGHNVEYRYINGQHSYRLLSEPEATQGANSSDKARSSEFRQSSGSESIAHTLLSGPAKAPEGLPTALAGSESSVAECLICGQRMLGFGLRCDDCKQRALDGSEASRPTGEKPGGGDGNSEPVGASASLPSSAGEQMRLVA